MSKLSSRFRIGEKMALGFGVVVLIFLAVIWHDHLGLQRVLGDYRSLITVYGARQSYAFAIESRLTAMRAASERFLGTRDPGLAAETMQEGDALLSALDGLAEVDAPSRTTAEAIRGSAATFLEQFAAIEAAWRVRGLDEESGLQGAFRENAHRLEEEVVRRLPGLQAQVLQLRRREKDYLLRGQIEYVHMVEGIALVLREAIGQSGIESDLEEELSRLVMDYERDFHALVDQDVRIAGLRAAMDSSAGRITPLVQRNLEEADRAMVAMRDRIAESSRAQAARNLAVAGLATLFGLGFAVLLTLRIVRPVREMADILDRLTHESPPERIPTTANPRDEVMAMAISLNALADHRATFDHWWQGAMREAIALRDRHLATDEIEAREAEAELRGALTARLEEARRAGAQLAAQGGRIREVVERIGRHPAGLSAEDVRALRQAVDRMQDVLRVFDDG